MFKKIVRILFGLAVAIVVLLVAVKAYRVFIANTLHANPDPEIYTVHGIDVSAHNGDIDFTRVKQQGIDFVFIKATEGTDFKDAAFVDNYRLACEAGMRVGAYHFFRFDTDGELQAINLLHSLRNRKLDLPPAIDVEQWGNPSGISTDDIVARLSALLSLLESQGYEPLIYTNPESYKRVIKGNFDDYPIWLCSLSDEDTGIPFEVWQYSHSGSIDGIKGDVDLNVMRAVNVIP